ncbi:hypothetical protein CF336_g6454, partial [Tilletia laevis]
MQLNSKLSLVLCALLVAQPIASAAIASHANAVELSPRSDDGNNKGFDLGDVLRAGGVFGGDNKDLGQGSGGGHFGNNNNIKKDDDDKKGGGKGGDDDDKGKGKGHGGGPKKSFREKKLKALKAAA